MSNPNKEPERVKLTEDYLKDMLIGIAYPAGTILERSISGQYIVPGTGLGQGGAVAFFSLISDICEPMH